jgi:hypothetical protein
MKMGNMQKNYGVNSNSLSSCKMSPKIATLFSIIRIDKKIVVFLASALEI